MERRCFRSNKFAKNSGNVDGATRTMVRSAKIDGGRFRPLRCPLYAPHGRTHSGGSGARRPGSGVHWRNRRRRVQG